MPAEWEPHRATWLAWPHNETDFPGKLETVQWVYVEIVRLLRASEFVEILVQDSEHADRAHRQLQRSGINEGYRFHCIPTNRSWLRDSAPTGVISSEGVKGWIAWRFSAWAKYADYELDATVPDAIASQTGRALTSALWHSGQSSPRGTHVVLEGGAIDVDGEGTLLTTEECLLSAIQERNPGFSRADYEGVFQEYLGATKTIWLAGSCVGDDTHGHIDDAARFIAPGRVVVAYDPDPSSPNHEVSRENVRILELARDAGGRSIEVIKLPFPTKLEIDGDPLPASYANFYIGNRTVLVPTFNDVNDGIVVQLLQSLFPTRRVVGVHSVDLVLGFGTLHCLSQQEPL